MCGARHAKRSPSHIREVDYVHSDVRAVDHRVRDVRCSMKGVHCECDDSRCRMRRLNSSVNGAPFSLCRAHRSMSGAQCVWRMLHPCLDRQHRYLQARQSEVDGQQRIIAQMHPMV